MLTVDNQEYQVRVIYPTLINSFEIREGVNSGVAQTGRQLRDVMGTAYSYTMEIEPDPSRPEDFDALYEVLSAPVDSHTVTLPYGQDSITFTAYVQTGSRTYYGKSAGKHRWKHMQIEFMPADLQRRPADV